MAFVKILSLFYAYPYTHTRDFYPFFCPKTLNRTKFFGIMHRILLFVFKYAVSYHLSASATKQNKKANAKNACFFTSTHTCPFHFYKKRAFLRSFFLIFRKVFVRITLRRYRDIFSFFRIVLIQLHYPTSQFVSFVLWKVS